MRQKTINIYTISEHPNKELCFEWIRDNWHDLGEHCLQEMADSLKALAKAVDGKLDYSLSIVPDSGEFVRITDFCSEKLSALLDKKDDCPLTGVCYDIDIIEALSNGELDTTVLRILHAEGEYIYSDEGLNGLCEANEYGFLENGELA